MGCGINSKPIRVVWLCHFVNQEMKDYFKTPKMNEMAPWINYLIELFKDRSEVELHIVAPNLFNNKDCNFKKGGISYHFYQIIPLPSSNIYIKGIYGLLKIDVRTNFYWIKHKILNCINQINPDLIHLHGAENPYYSAGILSLIDEYPTLTTVQGFIRNSSSKNYNLKMSIKIEETILKKSQHIGVRTDEMSRIVLEINPNATLHFHNYPIARPAVIKSNIGDEEPIDCLFFAYIYKEKGIEDLLTAISIIKTKYPNILLHVIGRTSNRYFSFLKTLCSKLNIEKNVQFVGFLPSQEDVYRHALQAKMCVLPTYHDIIPGTIIESMLMKLPVVAYAVGGIPELNNDNETVILVEKLNIKQLAEKIEYLLNNVEYRRELAEKAYKYACERFNNKNVVKDIIYSYNLILEANNNKKQ